MKINKYLQSFFLYAVEMPAEAWPLRSWGGFSAGGLGQVFDKNETKIWTGNLMKNGCLSQSGFIRSISPEKSDRLSLRETKTKNPVNSLFSSSRHHWGIWCLFLIWCLLWGQWDRSFGDGPTCFWWSFGSGQNSWVGQIKSYLTGCLWSWAALFLHIISHESCLLLWEWVNWACKHLD